MIFNPLNPPYQGDFGKSGGLMNPLRKSYPFFLKSQSREVALRAKCRDLEIPPTEKLSGFGNPSPINRDASTYRRTMVNFRITWTLCTGAVINSAYQIWGAKGSTYFDNSL